MYLIVTIKVKVTKTLFLCFLLPFAVVGGKKFLLFLPIFFSFSSATEKSAILLFARVKHCIKPNDQLKEC